MSGVFRAVGYTLLLALCGTSMFLGQGACKPRIPSGARGALSLACRPIPSVSPLLIGVRVAAAQSEDPLVDEGVDMEEEEADVEVEEEEEVGGVCRCPARVPDCEETVLICQSHEIDLCD